MRLARVDRKARMFFFVRSVHWLQEKMAEIQRSQRVEVLRCLGYHDLDLVPFMYYQWGALLGADADPVNADRHWQRAIGFYRHFEALRMHRRSQCLIELQERLATSEDYIATCLVRWPLRGDRVCERLGTGIFRTQHAIRADEIRVAETADRGRPVLFATRPQVAAGKATEYRWPPGMRAFALKRVENFLDAVHQRGSAENPKRGLSNKFDGYLISSSFHPRESHDKHGSSAVGTRAYLDSGVMVFGDITHDGKPQPAAGL